MKIRNIIATASMIMTLAPALSVSAADLPTGGHLPCPSGSTVPLVLIDNLDEYAIHTGDTADRNMEAGSIKMKAYDVVEQPVQEAHEQWVDINGVLNPVYTNVDCVLTEDNAPQAMASTEAALDEYNAERAGKTFNITSKNDKRFVYKLSGADGVIRVTPGGAYTYIPNQDSTKSTLVFDIEGSAAYTPVTLR